MTGREKGQICITITENLQQVSASVHLNTSSTMVHVSAVKIKTEKYTLSTVAATRQCPYPSKKFSKSWNLHKLHLTVVSFFLCPSCSCCPPLLCYRDTYTCTHCYLQSIYADIWFTVRRHPSKCYHTPSSVCWFTPCFIKTTPYLGVKKKFVVSGNPTDPSFYPPTLKIFMDLFVLKFFQVQFQSDWFLGRPFYCSSSCLSSSRSFFL